MPKDFFQEEIEATSSKVKDFFQEEIDRASEGSPEAGSGKDFFSEEVRQEDPFDVDLEELRRTQINLRQQAAEKIQAQLQEQQIQAADPRTWSSTRLKEHFRKNKPQTPEEQAQADALLEGAKQTEGFLKDQLLGGPDAQIRGPEETLSAPKKREPVPLKDILMRVSGVSSVVDFAKSEAAAKIMEKAGLKLTQGEERARANNILSISQQTGLPLAEVEEEYDSLRRRPDITGIKPDSPTAEELLTFPITGVVAVGMASHPIGTALGLMGFIGLDELENKIISTVKKKPYVFGAGENISDLLPDEASDAAKEIVSLIDFAGKGAVLGGVHRRAPKIGEFLTRQVIEKYNLPKKMYIDPVKVKEMFKLERDTNVISIEEQTLVKELGLDGKGYRKALREGVTIEIPSEKLVTVTDRPYWKALKEALKIKPGKTDVAVERAGEVRQGAPERKALPQPEDFFSREVEAKVTAPPAEQPASGAAGKPAPQPVALTQAQRQKFIEDLGGPQEQTKFGKAGELSDQDLSRLIEEANNPPIKRKRTAPLTLIAEIKKRGGIDPGKLRTGFGAEFKQDITEQGLLSMMKKGGRGLDEMAAQLVDEGVILIPEGETPDKFLMDMLKNRETTGKTIQQLEAEVERQAIEQEKLRDIADREGIPPEQIEAAERRGSELGEKQAESELAEGISEAVEPPEEVLAPGATEFPFGNLEAEPKAGALTGASKAERGGFADRNIESKFSQPDAGPNDAVHLPSDKGPYADVPIVFGGMDKIRPIEMPELVKLARELTQQFPSVKKLRSALGVFIGGPIGRIRLHPWIFIGREGLARMEATVAQMEADGKRVPAELASKIEFVKNNLQQRGNDLPEKVLAHEIGHAVDWTPTGELSRGNLIGRLISSTRKFMKGTFADLKNKELRDELKALTQFWKPFDEVGSKDGYVKYRYSSSEMYADFLSVLLNAPAKAREIAPKFYDAFFENLDRKPEFKQSFFELQDLINGTEADLLRVRSQDIRAMYEKGDALFRQKQLQREQAKKSPWFRLKYELIDKNVGLLEATEKVRKRQAINPEDDPRYLVEELTMMSSRVKADLEGFLPIYQELETAGISWDQFGEFLFLERVTGDREDLANPLGQKKVTAERQLQFLRDELGPEKTAELEALVQRTREWFREGNDLMAEDLLTPEQVELLNSNDKYAPFRVLSHYKDWVSAGIIRQVGTLNEIANPATTMLLKKIAMVRAYHRNKITKQIGNFLLKLDPDTSAAQVVQIPGQRPQIKPKEDLDTVMWKEGGKWKAIYTDPYIADSFKHDTSGVTQTLGDITEKVLLNQQIFRPLFITFNVGFQSINLARDFLRTWKNTPGSTLPKVLKAYRKSLPTSIRRVRGDLDPLINKMEKEGALNITYNDAVLKAHESNEDREIEAVMSRLFFHGIEPNKHPLLKPLVSLLNGIKFVGDVIETMPKVSGYNMLEGLPTAERAYRVRNQVGTPNFKRRGNAHRLTNSVFLFSNIFKEGWRGDFEVAFRNPTTRTGFWWKTAKYNLVPKIAMFLISAGYFGKEAKKLMDSATEYDKTNYHVIPLGQDGNGRAIYMRVPSDETGRVLGGLFWKLLNAPARGLSSFPDVINLAGGQLPGLAPLIGITHKWYQFLTGRNPRDEFRGRDILSEDQLKAGGLEALKPMVAWTINQSGQIRVNLHDTEKDMPLLERVIAGTPVVNRWIRITNYGQVEEAMRLVQDQRKQESKERLQRRATVSEGINDGLSPREIMKKEGGRTRTELRKVERAFDRELLRRTKDPILRALSLVQTNAQKVLILRGARKRFETEKEYRAYLNDIRRQGIISKEVRAELRRTQPAKQSP